MGYFCSSQPRTNCQLDSHRRWRQTSVALLRILPRTEWVGRDSWIRSGQDIRRTNHYISTTPESWKTLPKVNYLCKFAVFRSQHHPQRRSEQDPLLSAFWRGTVRRQELARISVGTTLYHCGWRSAAQTLFSKVSIMCVQFFLFAPALSGIL